MAKTKQKQTSFRLLIPLLIIVIGILAAMVLISNRTIFFNQAQVAIDSSDSGSSQPGSVGSQGPIAPDQPSEPYPTVDSSLIDVPPIPMPEVTGNLPPAPTEPPVAPPSGIACAMDAKICPDGTAVPRVPPNCEFAPCPGQPDGSITPILPEHPYPSPSQSPIVSSLVSTFTQFIDQIKRFFFR